MELKKVGTLINYQKTKANSLHIYIYLFRELYSLKKS